jgi:hypothetical protein
MSKKSTVIAQSAAGFLASLIIALPASATPAFMDVFSKKTALPDTPHHLPVSTRPMQATPSIGAGPGAMMSAHTPIVMWFEKFDQSIFNALPTASEKMILDQLWDKEVEKVRQTTETMNNIAKRYRRLAVDLRAMPVASNCPGIEDYRDAKANFFEGEASVYEDLIKPRKPAQTIEDLKDELQEIQSRSQMLHKGGDRLLAVDHDLRRQYSVHANRTTDSLYAYVNHRSGMPNK